MYTNMNDDIRNSIVISGIQKNYLFFVNLSSNLPESLCLMELWRLRGCSNTSCTPHPPL